MANIKFIVVEVDGKEVKIPYDQFVGIVDELDVKRQKDIVYYPPVYVEPYKQPDLPWMAPIITWGPNTCGDYTITTNDPQCTEWMSF